MYKLTDKLGPGIWDHALVALTFANRLVRRLSKQSKDPLKLMEQFCKKVEEWQDFVKGILPNIGLSKTQIFQLKIVPTGHPRRDPSLPDRPHWLSTFWFEALRSTHPRAQPALLRMNETRIVENPEMVDEKTCKQYTEEKTLIFSEYGDQVGKMMFGLEDFGSKVGLELAKFRELKLKEKIVLEQFLIMRLAQEQSGSDSSAQSTSDRVKPELLESVSVSQLLHGVPPEALSLASEDKNSTPSGLAAADGTPCKELEESYRSECGGPPY